MIDIKLLKKDEYTFAEIASIVKIDPRIIKDDFRRRKFPVFYKMVRYKTNFVKEVTHYPKKKICYIKKETLLLYIKYANMKKNKR